MSSKDNNREDYQQGGIAIASSLGKVMRIRIKLPKRSCESEHRTSEEGDHREIIYLCEMCGKGFRSRKALGGHMRLHSQRARSDVVENQAGNNVDRAGGGGDGDDRFEMEDERDEAGIRKTMCPICGRDFPSEKALFGHMRCHPERSWRGIQPPVCSSSSTVSEDDVTDYGDDDDRKDVNNKRFNVVDLEKDLLNFGWGAKSVRGREATVKSCAVSRTGGQNVLDSIPPEQAAGVQNLMLLSRGGADEGSGLINFIQNLNFKSSEILEASRSNEMKRKNSQVLTADGNCGMAFPDNKKLKVASNKVGIAGIHDFQTESDRWRLRLISGTFGSNDAEQKQGDDESEAKNAMHKVRKSLLVNDKHGLPVKLHQVSMEVADSQRYRCTTCNKSFSSHQALGGHKSSHNKLRNAQGLIRNDHPLPKRYVPAQGGDNGINKLAGVSQNLGLMADSYVHPLHQCNVCFKIYPTGQALGGHKRLPCSIANSKPLVAVLPAMVITMEPEVSPSLAHASDSNAGEVFNFDLNELPPSEDDGDHQDYVINTDNNDISAQSQQDLQDAAGEDLHVPLSA